jgi:hypothetical protein
VWKGPGLLWAGGSIPAARGGLRGPGAPTFDTDSEEEEEEEEEEADVGGTV